MALDIFIPSLSLAFEFNGAQHYERRYFNDSLEEQQLKDSSKRIACDTAGITLIEVPYWWDLSKDSLLATIHKSRPDLAPDLGNKPISTFPS